MERTTFVYDSDYSKEYSKQSCIKIFIIYFILALFFILSIYIIFFDYEDRNFIILLMTGFIFVSLILNILIWYKKQIKEYNSFNLHITDGYIEIKSNSLDKKINIDQIINIFTDNEENIIIKQSRFIQIKIMKYIENKVELVNILSNIKVIEPIKKKSNYIQYIQSIFFIGIVIINRIGNIPLYIIFALGIIISSVYSSLIIIHSGSKKKIIIGNIIINLIFIIVFSIGLFFTINYLLNGK